MIVNEGQVYKRKDPFNGVQQIMMVKLPDADYIIRNPLSIPKGSKYGMFQYSVGTTFASYIGQEGEGRPVTY